MAAIATVFAAIAYVFTAVLASISVRARFESHWTQECERQGKHRQLLHRVGLERSRRSATRSILDSGWSLSMAAGRDTRSADR
jgi:hypothetical protein